MKALRHSVYNLFKRNRCWLTLIFLGCIIYANTFFSSFHFDDAFIIDNFSITTNRNPQAIWNLWPTRFIANLTFLFNYRFHQLDVFWYHLFNLAVHLGAAILVWWLAVLIFSTPSMKGSRFSYDAEAIALFIALIFLSHPVQTEAVTYIYQRSTSLAAFFYLFSLCLYIKSRLLRISNNPLSKWGIFYAFSLVCGILSMFTKENSVTLPLMILLCEFYFFRADKDKRWKYAVFFLFILPVVPILLFSAKPPTFHEDLKILLNQPVNTGGYYFLTQLRVMVTYIRLLFVPINQNLDYDYRITNSLMDLPTWGSFFILVAIMIAATRIFSRHRLLSFGIFWFFLALLPESSIIPLKDVIFEHRLYLPVAGYSFFIVGGLHYLFQSKPMQFTLTVLACLVICYAVMTYQRNKAWRDELTLWNDTVNKSSQKARPYNNRGNAYLEKGDFLRAISDYDRAIELDPGLAEAYNDRGLAYLKKGDIDRAVHDYSQAIEIKSAFAEVYCNRGNAYVSKGNLDEAILDYNKAIEIKPGLVGAYCNRGNAYLDRGEFSRAISDYDRAIELNPTIALIYDNRGIAYLNKGEFSRAISDYDRAIELDPGLAEAYSNRGTAYLNKGDFSRAISDYDRAIEINPGLAVAYYGRASVYLSKEEYSRAWDDLHKAEGLGYRTRPEFTEQLKRASGRGK